MSGRVFFLFPGPMDEDFDSSDLTASEELASVSFVCLAFMPENCFWFCKGGLARGSP